MSVDGQGTKCRRNIAENFYRMSRVHEHCRRQTDRQQMDGWATANSKCEREFMFTFVNVSSRSLKMILLKLWMTCSCSWGKFDVAYGLLWYCCVCYLSAECCCKGLIVCYNCHRLCHYLGKMDFYS